MPLIVVFVAAFGEAIVFDVVHNLKPELHVPPPHSHSFSLASKVYGGILGLLISGCIYLTDEAVIAALMLSPSYRKKMIARWRNARSKLLMKSETPEPEEATK